MSFDVISVCVLLLCMPIFLFVTLPQCRESFTEAIALAMDIDCRVDWTEAQFHRGAALAILDVVGLCAPVMAAAVLAAIVGTFSQIGVFFEPGALEWKFDQIFHVSFEAILPSRQNLVNLGLTTGKVAAIALVVYIAVGPDMDKLVQLMFEDMETSIAWIGSRALLLLLKIVALLAVLAALDFIYKHIKFHVDLRMTKEEVKDERKNAEGDPAVKAKIRSKMIQLLKRIINEVPKADVVVTNPTHVAVALKYDPAEPAPRVLAKGLRKRALRIKEIARQNGIPVIENPPLARALYRSAPVGGFIPPQFFGAVAALLAKLHKAGIRRFDMSKASQAAAAARSAA